MAMLYRFAFLAALFLAVPTKAEASSGRYFCHFFPSFCQSGGSSGGGSTAVPELDANAAGTAGALAIGAALLLAPRRRRRG